jgi:hypothetical protein
MAKGGLYMDDDKEKKYGKKCGDGIARSNIVGFAVALANVTDADYSNAQANAAVLVAGDDINAKFENDVQSQDDND